MDDPTDHAHEHDVSKLREQITDAVMAEVGPALERARAACCEDGERTYAQMERHFAEALGQAERERDAANASWYRMLLRADEAEAYLLDSERRRIEQGVATGEAIHRAEQAEARLAELENALAWQTSCTSCARGLDATIKETERAEQAEAERDHWKREHDELAEKWAILGERVLVASALLAEAPPDVEAELAPQRYDLLRKVLAGEAGRDDMLANLVPKLAEAERRRDERTEAERDALNAANKRARKLAEELAALAPEGDWGTDIPDTVTADVARQFIAVLDTPAPRAHPVTDDTTGDAK